jgi:hypothetical protein
LKAGKAEAAERVYLEDLQKYPKNPWSLFGLRQALDAGGKKEEVDVAQRNFNKAWAKADIQMTASCLCLK